MSKRAQNAQEAAEAKATAERIQNARKAAEAEATAKRARNARAAADAKATAERTRNARKAAEATETGEPAGTTGAGPSRRLRKADATKRAGEIHKEALRKRSEKAGGGTDKPANGPSGARRRAAGQGSGDAKPAGNAQARPRSTEAGQAPDRSGS